MATGSIATSTRSARCATRKQPDRPLAEVQRLSGWLVEREGRIWLERGCSSHGLVRTLYDESPEILTYLEQWTAPTKVHTPDVAGNFAPVPAAYADGLPEMQTQHTCILLEDLLDHCNLKCPTCFAASAPALASVVPLERGARLDRRATLPRERPYRRADAQRRRAHPLPATGRAARRGGQAPDRAGAGEQQRARHRAGRRAPRGPARPPGAGRGLPAVRRRVGRGLHAPPWGGHPQVQGAGDRAARRCRDLHHPHDDGHPRRQRRRDRGGDQASAGHAVRRRRHHPAGLRIRSQRRTRPDGPADPHRRAGPAGGADRRAGDLARPDGAAVLAPALLLGGLPAARRLGCVAVAGRP